MWGQNGSAAILATRMIKYNTCCPMGPGGPTRPTSPLGPCCPGLPLTPVGPASPYTSRYIQEILKDFSGDFSDSETSVT